MNSIWLATANLAAAIWVGTIVYQSTVVAATVFKTLDSDQARDFLRVIFPRFYKLGLFCAILLLICVSALGFAANWNRVNLWLPVAVSVMIIAQLISIWLVPRINAAADLNRSAFKRGHTLSILLTVLIVLLGIGILYNFSGALD